MVGFLIFNLAIFSETSDSLLSEKWNNSSTDTVSFILTISKLTNYIFDMRISKNIGKSSVLKPSASKFSTALEKNVLKVSATSLSYEIILSSTNNVICFELKFFSENGGLTVFPEQFLGGD